MSRGDKDDVTLTLSRNGQPYKVTFSGARGLEVLATPPKAEEVKYASLQHLFTSTALHTVLSEPTAKVVFVFSKTGFGWKCKKTGRRWIITGERSGQYFKLTRTPEGRAKLRSALAAKEGWQEVLNG